MGRQSQSRQARRAQNRRQQSQLARRGARGGTNWSLVAGAAIVVVAVAVFAAAALGVFRSQSASSAAQATATALPSGKTIAGLHCDQGMPSGVQISHTHAHLEILNRGKPETISPDFGHDLNNDCLYWMHSHSDANGIIHMEAPHPIHPTLATWYAIAKETLPQAGDTLPRITPPARTTEKVWVNQKPYHGDPLQIKLYQHMNVWIEFGPPFVKPTPFNFKAIQL